MEGSKAEKRIKPDDSEEKLVEPSLVRINKHGCAPHNIHVDKNEVLRNINFLSSAFLINFSQ